MTWWHRLSRRRKLEEQLDREMRFHLDQHAADLIAGGQDPAEARRQARLALGGPEQVKEECRDARGTRWLEELWQDFRYAARTLRQRPAFTAVGAITVALGIGASTAIFSAVNPILFEPLPYPHAGRILMIWDVFQGARSDVTFHTYRELAARSRSFEAMAVMEACHSNHEQRRPTRAIRGAERDCGILPCAGRLAGAGKGLPASRRPVQRPACDHP